MSEPGLPPADTPAPRALAPVTGAATPGPIRRLSFLLVAVLVAGGVAGYLWYRYARGVTTDDAFVRADVAQVAAEVSGRLTELRVLENRLVEAGDVLVVLDPEPYRLRVDQARAALEAALAEVRRTEKASAAAAAQVRLGEAHLAEAKREAAFHQALVEAGSSVREAAEKAAAAVRLAEASVAAAREQRQAAAEAIAAAEARAASAETARTLAERDLAHTEVRAPVSGVATKISAVAGDVIRPGQPLLAVVPHEVYVVANFKETDLADVHPGDRVEVSVDAYPDAPITGHVDSLGAGTSAAFSLLPADNPSGNFVKVVQRVPVRISLDHGTVDGRLLAVGLSVEVRVPRDQARSNGDHTRAGRPRPTPGGRSRTPGP
ncbi:HlyD family secretion protein [Myxococcota bacterium]|nr:HlyD family secretion protein [Myxococcota bacterium]